MVATNHEYEKHENVLFEHQISELHLHLHFTFSRFADAFIQSDLQLGNT